MSSKKELQLAYGMAIALLIVGVISYAAFSAKPPDTPVRLLYQNAAGKVLFDHKTHTAESGYGVACTDCHHHPEDAETMRACRECHITEEGQPTPQVCMECHDPGDIEGYEIIVRKDAFHGQCAGCHDQIGAGPKAQECGSCHAM